MAKREHNKKKAPLNSHSVSGVVFNQMHIDCVGPLKTSVDGYKNILVIVDLFSKFTQAYPLKTVTGKKQLTYFLTNSFLPLVPPPSCTRTEEIFARE